MKEKYDVFFSYNRIDRAAVRQVAFQLRQAGIRVWIDEEELPLGQMWQSKLEIVLQNVHSAAILLGPSRLGDWQKQEVQLCITQSVKRGIPVIPVLLPGGPPPEELPILLADRSCADLRMSSEEQFRRLVKNIRDASPTDTRRRKGSPQQKLLEKEVSNVAIDNARSTRSIQVLILGIMGIVCCAVLAPVAWYLGNQELKAIREGRSPIAGEGFAKAGVIIGFIGTIWMVFLVLWIFFWGGMAMLQSIAAANS